MSLRSQRRFWFATLRGRLILAVAAVHAVMMSLFAFDSTVRQRALLLNNQQRQAVALSQSLATSAAGWMAADDIAGLQELVEAQHRYPELHFALVADERGRVLADTDTSKVGRYLVDLPADGEQTVLRKTPGLVDVAVPAAVGGRSVGWARVGIGQEATSGQLSQLVATSVLYAGLAIAIGSLIAWRMGFVFTRRLYAVQDTMGQVRRGGRAARCAVTGSDEAAAMARDFNTLLDSLDERDEALVRSEARYRTLIENIQAAVVVHDRDTRVLMSNAMARDLLGLRAEEMAEKTSTDPSWCFLQQDGTALGVAEYPVELALSSGGPVRNLTLGVCRPGLPDPVWVLVSADPMRDPYGGISEVIVTFVDITERKRAEEALQESEERYRLLHEHAGVGIGYYTPDGRVISYNRMAADYMQGSIEDFRGKPVCELFPEEDAALYLGRIRRSLASESVIEYEDHVDLPSGGRWLLSAFARVRDTRGCVVGVQIISQDITRRKQAEAKIQQLNQELEQRVLERTLELEAANKELEAFAYSVSHDLRAPLRHIDAFLELLRESLAPMPDARSEHYMATISAAAKRMGLLIDDLLAFSRLGRRGLSPTPVDLNVVVAEIIEEFEPEIRHREVRWTIGPLPVVSGDQPMLRMALINLISNALKFTQPRSRTEIEVTAADTPDEFVISVRDNGVGFDPVFTDKLFGVFQRLHSSDQFEGTGIGLANVRRVIARHGGRTWARGEVGHGATFFISLPR